MVKTKELQSSLVGRVMYWTEAQRLYVEFTNGPGREPAFYSYRDVPGVVWNAFLRAESHGKYFIAHIREEFTHEKMSDSEFEEIWSREANKQDTIVRIDWSLIKVPFGLDMLETAAA